MNYFTLLTENKIAEMTAVCGLIFTLTGLVMFYFPPKKINPFYGYRTTSSTKNIDRWHFAQKYAAKELIKFGLVLLICCLVSLAVSFTKQIPLGVALCIFIAIAALLIYRVELAIKKKFKV